MLNENHTQEFGNETSTLGYNYVENDGDSYLVENNNSVFMRYIGVGDQLSLYFLTNNGEKEFYTRTYKNRLKQYFDTNGIEFKNLTKQDLINMN
jgi:hypothetical protein